jgi:hypothetical protein
MRAVAWIGVVVVGWSLNIRWGADEFLGNGPPVTFQKHVVGALLLGLVAALAISITQKLAVKGVGAAAAIGGVLIAISIRSNAPETVTSGSGWTWMTVGTALLLAGTAATLLVRPQAPKPSSRRRR